MRSPVWLGYDPVIQLREWASETVHALPADGRECLMGSSRKGVDLQLVDPEGLVSRRHARLVRVGMFWEITDLQSKNGLLRDNVEGQCFEVLPGTEITLGSLTLIAENRTLIRLRAYLARVLGWDVHGRTAVERALREIRLTALRRVPLVLASVDDLVSVARQIHLRTTRPPAGFVVCGPHAKEADKSVRVTATCADQAQALALGAGGSICVRASELPSNYDRLEDATTGPRAKAQLIFCATDSSRAVNVPPLVLRSAADRQRVVAEYAFDAIQELDAPAQSFTEANRRWVASHAETLTEVEIATLRIVARSHARTTHAAARLLGISHVALGKWFRLRQIK